MADKITLGSIASFQNDTTAVVQYNANSALITTGLDNTLSLDGTSPNQMNAPLDMNSQPIINLPAPSTLDSPLRLADINSIISVIPTINIPGSLRYVFKNINFNTSNTDNIFAFTLPAGVTRWRNNATFIYHASASLSSATVGLFTGPGGTGQTLAANQAITLTQTAENTNLNLMQLALTNPGTESYNVSTVYFRIGTPQGSAATADVAFTIIPLA